MMLYISNRNLQKERSCLTMW